MNIQKILILSDFSNTSSSLLNYGLTLAEQLDAQVWVQHTFYLPPNAVGDVYIPANTLEEYEHSIRREFNGLKKQLPALQEKKVQLVVNHGDLVPQMNQLIDKEQINLVVIGSRGGGGFLTNILGSNTIKIIQHAHCPVLTVPQGTIFQPFQRMALAVDLKEVKVTTYNYILHLASIFQAQVDIVHVSEQPVNVKQMAALLDFKLHEVEHTFFNILSEDIDKGIAAHVEKNDIGLLVLLPRAHAFFDRIFQKSITRQLAFQEKVPLLTIHQ